MTEKTMNTCKVMLVNKFFFIKGGAETVYFQEKAMLEEMGSQVVEFSMDHEKNFSSQYAEYFVGNSDYHKKQSKIDQLKIAVDFIHNREACKKFKQLLKQEQPDIVHFHNIYHQLTPSIIKIAKKQGCKTVLTAHDYKIACPNYSMQINGKNVDVKDLTGNVFSIFKTKWDCDSWAKSLLISVEAVFHNIAKSYENLDLVIAPSEFMKKVIQLRRPQLNVEVIVNGIDATVGNVEVKNKGYFLYLGRIMEDKGVETLALAQQLSKHQSPVKMAGIGPMTDELRENYPNIELLGFQQGEALTELIANCTALIVPSLCYENCSMSLLEAMAYKKAVIGADIGGIPEQVIPSETGYIFEAGNAQDLAAKMDLLMDNPTQAVTFGENGRKQLIKKYSFEMHKTKLLRCFSDLIESKENEFDRPTITVIGTRGIPDVLGGVETHCQHLYPMIKANYKSDICVIARSPYVSYCKGTYKKVNLKTIWAPKKKSLEAIVHSTLAAFSTVFDKSNIVHVHAIGPGLVVPLLRLLGKKVVFTHHGPDYDRQKWGALAKFILRMGEKCAVKYANEVIVISEVINKLIQDKYGRLDAHLIYNGVEKATKLGEEQTIEILSRYKLEKQGYFVTVGRLVEEKGFHDLIDAYRQLQTNTPLVIVGDSDHASEYSDKLKKEALANGVIMTGFLKGESLKTIFSQGKVFIIPSYHEGLPIALLEALSYSLPVIASNIPANLEVKLPEECYFGVGNVVQLKQQLANHDAISFEKQDYSVYLNIYDWYNIAGQVFNVYQKVLK